MMAAAQQHRAHDLHESASAVIEQLYASINRQDVDAIATLLAEDCIYEDLHIFPQPMHGRKEVVDFLAKFFKTVGPDVHFVIEGITRNDPSSVGLMWHLDHKGNFLPMSKGCSFYRLEDRNGKLQVTYGRDIIEPPSKPGAKGLEAIKGSLDTA